MLELIWKHSPGTGYRFSYQEGSSKIGGGGGKGSRQKEKRKKVDSY